MVLWQANSNKDIISQSKKKNDKEMSKKILIGLQEFWRISTQNQFKKKMEKKSLASWKENIKNFGMAQEFCINIQYNQITNYETGTI